MVKQSGPEPRESLLKEWESQPLLASIAKYTPNIAERPLTATKQVFGCWLSITQPTPCCKRRNHSLPTLKKPFPYKVHVFFSSCLPFFCSFSCRFLWNCPFFVSCDSLPDKPKKNGCQKPRFFFGLSEFLFLPGTDFKNMAQGLKLAIDLHIHEVFSKVGLPEQTTKKIA